FGAGMDWLRKQGYGLFIEVGPGATLLGLGTQSTGSGDPAWLASLRRGRDENAQMLESLGELYVRGATVDWPGFDHEYSRRKVSLPTYAFRQRRYWITDDQPPAQASE